MLVAAGTGAGAVDGDGGGACSSGVTVVADCGLWGSSPHKVSAVSDDRHRLRAALVEGRLRHLVHAAHLVLTLCAPPPMSRVHDGARAVSARPAGVRGSVQGIEERDFTKIRYLEKTGFTSLAKKEVSRILRAAPRCASPRHRDRL